MIGFGKHRRPADPREKRDRQRARENLARHEVKERVSRSFDFRQPGTSNYAYSLTWTPGSLSLAGDCGELTLVHYQALWTLRDGLAWAQSSDVNYLLSKSSRRQVVDREGTVRWIVDHANEEAIRTLRGHREELQDWRRTPHADGFYGWYDPDEDLSYDEWLSARPEPLKTRERQAWNDRRHRYETAQVAEDGFELWEKLRARFIDYLPMDDVYTAKGRARIKDELESWVDGVGEDDLGAFCYYDMGFECGPDTRWDFQSLQQIECIRQGAAMALQLLDAEAAQAEAEAA